MIKYILASILLQHLGISCKVTIVYTAGSNLMETAWSTNCYCYS